MMFLIAKKEIRIIYLVMLRYATVLTMENSFAPVMLKFLKRCAYQSVLMPVFFAAIVPKATMLGIELSSQTALQDILTLVGMIQQEAKTIFYLPMMPCPKNIGTVLNNKPYDGELRCPQQEMLPIFL